MTTDPSNSAPGVSGNLVVDSNIYFTSGCALHTLLDPLAGDLPEGKSEWVPIEFPRRSGNTDFLAGEITVNQPTMVPEQKYCRKYTGPEAATQLHNSAQGTVTITIDLKKTDVACGKGILLFCNYINTI